MSSTDYESLSYKLKFNRAVRTGIIILVVALIVAAPVFWAWRLSIEKRQVFREAKDVVLNMNLLSPEFLADSIYVSDKSKPSGLSIKAEERIRSHSEAEGEIMLISWSRTLGCAVSVDYQRGHFLVSYRYDKDTKEETWDIFFRVNQFDNHKG